MINFRKIIFVCQGNTCRSPMAATIMNAKLLEAKLDILVESRGMVVLFSEPYNPKAIACAAKHDMIMPNNSASQIKNSDFDRYTLVLVMDSEMKNKIYDNYEDSINVYTLGEFTGISDLEVKDPYGKGTEEYNHVFEQLEEVVEKVYERLIKEDL